MVRSPTAFVARSYRTSVVVLRTHNLGETDRIVTLLSSDRGQIRAVARGVRRTNSKFGARLEPFMVSDVQIVLGRSLDVVSQAVARSTYGPAISSHYEKYTVASAIAETAQKLTDDDQESAATQYRLLVGALGALARGTHDPSLILDAYLLRALAAAGWSASFSACARCGAPGPHQAFSAARGGTICENCSDVGVSIPQPGTVDLLGALLSGNWKVAEEAAAPCRREASVFVAAFVQWHLERSLRAFRLVER